MLIVKTNIKKGIYKLGKKGCKFIFNYHVNRTIKLEVLVLDNIEYKQIALYDNVEVLYSNLKSMYNDIETHITLEQLVSFYDFCKVSSN